MRGRNLSTIVGRAKSPVETTVAKRGGGAVGVASRWASRNANALSTRVASHSVEASG